MRGGHLRLVVGAHDTDKGVSSDHEVITEKIKELNDLNAQSVLAMREMGDEKADAKLPLNLMSADLERFETTHMAQEAIVMQELVKQLRSKGVALSTDQQAALNNYIARQKWNMPASQGSLLVPRESPEVKDIKTQIEARKTMLLKQHLAGLGKIVDDLARAITVHWLDTQTRLLSEFENKAKEEARADMIKQGLGGLAFLNSFGTGLQMNIDDGTSATNVASLGEKRKLNADKASLEAAKKEFNQMLTGPDLYIMSHVAANHENPLVRAAAASENRARKYIQQQAAQAAIRFWKEFVHKEVAQLLATTKL